MSGHSVLLGTLSLAVAALVLSVLAQGWDYYATPYAERPHHEGFRVFRSAGEVGHGLGILGSAMVLLLLLYSVRKRHRRLRNLGPLRTWLRYHIFLGVAGPVLITLHTAFKVEGLVAVSYYSMAAVALSGVFGRYLYQQIPRNVLGEALSEQAIEDGREELLVQLSERFGMDQAATDALDRIALDRLGARSTVATLLVLPVVNLGLARRLHSWAMGIDGQRPDEVLDLARRWVLLTRRLHLFRQINDLFHYWHVFHKPFAIIMILVMIVHVAVAVTLGYTWIV